MLKIYCFDSQLYIQRAYKIIVAINDILCCNTISHTLQGWDRETDGSGSNFIRNCKKIHVFNMSKQ